MRSYRKNHVKNRIHRIRPKHSIFTRLWFWLVVLFLVIASAIFYGVFFYPGFQINNILISGNEKVKTADLMGLAVTGVNTKIIDFWNIKINSRSIFLLNPDNLDKTILKKFPVIENINITRKLPQTLSLEVTERKPAGVFCDNQNKCFLIDNNGIIYEETSNIPQDMVVVRQSINGDDMSTGSDVVQKSIINSISKIQKNLKDNFQIDLADALISTPLRLDVRTKENWQIYFDIEEGFDINSQIARLNLLLSGDITPQVRKTLQYIDLRFRDRAFYK